MKLKRTISKISLFLTILIILTTLSTIPVSAAQIGDKLGNVLNTDIKVFINGSQIPSYTVNNKMSIVMEDLENYGFDVTYENNYRTLTAVRDYHKNFKPIKNIPDNITKIRSVAFQYVHTDIKAYLYDDRIESFAISGRIVIYIDDLSDFGSFSWDEEKRELKLQLYEAENSREAINPYAKGSSQQSEEIKKLVYNYSPSGAYILTSLAHLTSNSAAELISVWYWNDDDLFGTLNKAIHEICHMYTDEVINYEKIESGIKYTAKNYEYDENDNLIFNSKYIVEHNPVNIKFPVQKIKTEEATAKLPQNLRTYRWELYASKGSVTSSNIDGVYGLLNELHSYYYGCLAVIDCYEYLYGYLNKYGYSEKLVIGYLDSILSDMLAFYEFKYWTLEYLAYLQKHYPNEYINIMNNEDYKKVFVYLHDNFEKLAEETIQKNIKLILDKLKSLNIDCEEDEYTIWIGNTGRGKFTKEIELIKKEINGSKHKNIMNDLRR